MENLSERFHNYFTTVNRSLLACLFDTLENPTLENFHQLRISLKRLRFIGKTLMHYKAKGISKGLRPYRSVFRYAGRIRQQQVHATLLSRHGVDQSHQIFTKKLRGNHGKLLKKWPGVAQVFLADAVRAYPVLGGVIRAWDIREEEYVRELSDRVCTRFRSELPDEILHESRKLLKEVLYSCEVSRTLRSAFDARFNLRTAVRLEDAIGDWHDLDLLLNERLGSEALTKGKIRQHLEAEKKRERKKIERLVPKLLRGK
jgi:CHAD domain-containing protein